MAALPKPLSQKSIQKMLEGWNPETVDKLHDYYAAFSNLYGVIMLSDAWKIIKQYEPKMRKKEFMDFSSIARREDLPYYVIEIDELYCDEPRVSDAQRFIINKALVSDGYYRFNSVYKLIEMQLDKPFYRPEKLTDFTENADSRQWSALCDHIRKIKTSGGIRLSELTFLNEWDKLDLEYYKSQRKKNEILKRASIPLSERIIRVLWLDMNTADDPMAYLSHALEEADAKLTMAEYEKLLRLWQDANNHSHHWANRGWTPIALRQRYGNPAPKSMSFGSGLKKAFADGNIDKNELIEKLKAMGISVEE